MKHLFLYVTVCAFTLFSFSGCSTKINTAAPYHNITVVYGILDQGDTAHYIQIQKAFLSQTLSAYDMAKVADSNFYPQLNVVMEGINSSGSIVTTFPLTRVNLNTEGYPRAQGAFTDSNYAYKFKAALDPANTYRLVITNPQTGETDSSETTIIDETATNFSCPFLDVPGYNLDFTHVNSQFNINGNIPSSAAFVSGILRIRWVDKNSQTGTSTKMYADWDFATTVPIVAPGGGNVNGYVLNAKNGDFYNFLETGMQPAPQFVTRLIDSAYLEIYAANADFYKYMQVTQTLGTGLTGSDIQPNYTNMKGKYVMGLFAGRGLRSGYMSYEPLTIDSIMADPDLQNLNIKGTTY